MNAFIRVMGMALILGGLLLFWPVLLIAGLAIVLFWVAGAWATK
jgi:hypothetical protein